MKIVRTLFVVAALTAGVAPAYAQATGTIAGILTDHYSGAPLASQSTSSLGQVLVCVASATDSSGCVPNTSASASTGADGRYTIQNLAPGSYYVRAGGPQATYIPEVHPDIPCISVDCTVRQGTPVTVSAGVTTTVDFRLSQGGAIVGTVRRADTGAGILRQLFLYNSQGSAIKSVYSNFQGTIGSYGIGSLPTGNYYLTTENVDAVQEFLGVVYPNVPCRINFGGCRPLDGTPIAVIDGVLTSGIDFSLAPGGVVSGTITAADTGAPLRVDVRLISGGVDIGFSSTNDAGRFTFTGVVPGNYYVRAVVPASVGYANAFYGGATPVAITVSAGATSGGVDFSLARPTFGSIGGAISTSITADFGRSGYCARIAAYDAAGRFVRAGRFQSTHPGWPHGYTIDDLSPGTYYVRFENPACSSFSVWGFSGGITPDVTYGAGACITVDCDVRRGAPVTVAAGAATTHIDFTIERGGSIMLGGPGMPSPGAAIAGRLVELYDARGVRVRHDRLFAPAHSFGHSGSLSFVGLPPGAYYVRTIDGRQHDGIVCPDCAATAGRPIIVGPAQGATATLAAAPVERRVSGIVRDDTGAPLSTVTVTATNEAVPGAFSATAVTDATGRFDMSAFFGSGLAAGRYFVSTGNTRRYVDQLWQAIECAGCDPSSGTPIALGAADATGIDFALRPAAVIRAVVTDAGGVGIKGQAVSFFDPSNARVARATTDTSGTAIAQVRPGSYSARTDPANGYIVTSTAPVAASFASDASISLIMPTCAPSDVAPSIVASAVAGRPYRQVFRPTTPNTRVSITTGRLPAGLTLDPVTGVLSGTPTESGVFNFTLAAIDSNSCAFLREYTLQVSQCAFVLSADSVTVGASGGIATVTASDVCGYSAIESQASWITADASSATSATPLNLTIAANPQSSARVGTVAIGRRLFTVRQAGQASSAPFGTFETPAPGAQVSGSIAVSGWALDDVEVARVRILRDPVAGERAGPLVFIGNAVLVEGARPDVERAYPALPRNTRAGWGYLLLTSMLPNQGNGTFRIHAIADDAEGHAVVLGVRTIVAANAAGTVPFGAIDTPAQGETVSGTAYRNIGWALTPQPKFIPTDGSTIQVLVDGVPIGNAAYNFFRSDVASLFPGLQNSAGPIGYRDLDTTALGEGVHTIAWVVTDSAGAASGIGSRYFAVRNSADAQPSGLFLGSDTGLHAASLQASSRSRRYAISPLQTLSVTFPSTSESCDMSYAAYLVANGEVRDLPTGAAISPSGAFSWQPGPAFSGRYEFAIVGTNCEGVKTRQSLVVHVGNQTAPLTRPQGSRPR